MSGIFCRSTDTTSKDACPPLVPFLTLLSLTLPVSRCAGRVYKYDMSMAPQRMFELVEQVKDRLTGVSKEVVVAGYGHYGDGNLHLNVSDGRRGLQQVSPLPAVLIRSVDAAASTDWAAVHAAVESAISEVEPS